MKNFLKLVGLVGVVSVGAFAAGNLTAPTLNMTDVYTIAGALVTGLASLWVVRRAIHLLGR